MKATVKTILIMGMVGLVLAAVWILVLPNERQQWSLAAAREARLNRDWDRALALLEDLVQRHPDDPLLALEQVEVLAASGRVPEGRDRLRDFRQVVQYDYPVHEKVASVLHQLGQHDLAYEEMVAAHRHYQEKAEAESLRNARQLEWANGLAYFAYLAEQDEMTRWRDLDQAILRTSSEEAFALYRSQALRMVGRSEQALEVVRQAGGRLASSTQRVDARLKRRISDWMAQPDWPPDQEPEWLSIERTSLAERRLILGWLYEQAEEICQDLGDWEAMAEFRSWGRGSREIPLRSRLDFAPQSVAMRLLTYAAYVDTRGVLATRLGELKSARQDLDNVIEAVDLARAITQEIGLANSPTLIDVRKIRQREESVVHELAIYHYHRMLLAEAMGDPVQAELDRQAVLDLGRQPGPGLY